MYRDDKARCDMRHECEEPVTHIDDHGFIYCESHGKSRSRGGMLCRRMTSEECAGVRAGFRLKSYYRPTDGSSNVTTDLVFDASPSSRATPGTLTD